MKTKALLSICTVFCTLFSVESIAQTIDTTVSAPAVIDSVKPGHNANDLSKLKKVDLTKIYLDQLTKMVYTLGKTSIKEGDVPGNKYTDNHWNAINKSSDKYNAVILKMYTDIIPYSDREDIIESILFFQEIISRMDAI